MKFYELNYLTSANISEEELKSIEEKISSLIQKEGGIFDKIDLPQKKNLAYPVKKNKSAYFCNLSFSFLPEKIASLEKILKAEKKILRYMIKNKKIRKRVTETSKSRRRNFKPKIEKVEKVKLKEIEKKLEEILDE